MHSLRLQRSPDSPDHLDRKLNLARGRLRGRDQARVRDRMPAGVEYISIVEWRSKICAIQNIKEFGPELDVKVVGDFLDVIVFEQGKIQIHQSRADDRVAAQVTPQIQASPRVRHGVARHWIDVDYVNAIGCDIWRGRRNAEALRPDIVNWIARIHDGTAAGTAHQTRHINVGISTFHTKGIAAKARSKRHARARFKNPSDFPSAEGPTPESVCPLRRADFPGVVQLDVVSDVEIRQPSIQFHGEEQWARDRIRVFISHQTAGRGINRFSPGIRGLDLRATPDLCLNLHLERVVKRIALPETCVDEPGILVEPLTQIRRRPQIPLGSQRWQNDVRILYPEELVHTPRTNVTHP